MLDLVRKLWPIYLYDYNEKMAKEVVRRIKEGDHRLSAEKVRFYLYQLTTQKSSPFYQQGVLNQRTFRCEEPTKYDIIRSSKKRPPQVTFLKFPSGSDRRNIRSLGGLA